jgi:hypothetical protein
MEFHVSLPAEDKRQKHVLKETITTFIVLGFALRRKHPPALYVSCLRCKLVLICVCHCGLHLACDSVSAVVAADTHLEQSV